MALRLLNLLGRHGCGEFELRAGSYLTDGRGLFRVLGWVRVSRTNALICLEDCKTLDHRVHTPRELRDMRIQAVAADEDVRTLAAG